MTPLPVMAGTLSLELTVLKNAMEVSAEPSSPSGGAANQTFSDCSGACKAAAWPECGNCRFCAADERTTGCACAVDGDSVDLGNDLIERNWAPIREHLAGQLADARLGAFQRHQ